MSFTPQQMNQFAFYGTGNAAPIAAQYLGTFQVVLIQGNLALSYGAAGPASMSGNDPTQNVPIQQVDANSFQTNENIIIAGTTYGPNQVFTWNGTTWAATITGATQTQQVTTAPAMLFPYGNDYVFMVYNGGSRGSQDNQLGGAMTLGTMNGSDFVTITVNGSAGTAQVTPQATQTDFGHIAGGLSITLANGTQYQFNPIFYAFTDAEGRAVLWGNLQISGNTGSFQFVAIEWPATGIKGLPKQSWTVRHLGVAVGTLSFEPNPAPPPSFPITFTPANSNTSVGVAAPTPLVTFTNPVDNFDYCGMAQLIILDKNGNPNPSSHPANIMWQFGGTRTQHTRKDVHPPRMPETDDDWSTDAQIGNDTGPGVRRAKADGSYA